MTNPVLFAALLFALSALAGCNPDVESGGAGNSSDGENTTPILGEGAEGPVGEGD